MYKPMEQIEKEYDGHWVFMVNCTQNERGTLLGGEVVLHGECSGSIANKIKDVKKKKSLTFFGYVGNIPEGVVFL